MIYIVTYECFAQAFKVAVSETYLIETFQTIWKKNGTVISVELA